MVPIRNHSFPEAPKRHFKSLLHQYERLQTARQSSRPQQDKGEEGTVALNHVGTRVMMSPFCGLSNGWQAWHHHHTTPVMVAHITSGSKQCFALDGIHFFCFPPTIAQASWCAIENCNLHIHRNSTTEPTANGCNVYWQLASWISGQIYDGPLPRAKWGFLSQERCAKHTCCFDGREDSSINCSRTSGNKNKISRPRGLKDLYLRDQDK